MPEYKYVRVHFLQAMLEGHKKEIKREDCKARLINKNWPEFAIKNVWDQVKEYPEVLDYLPDDEISWDSSHTDILFGTSASQ